MKLRTLNIADAEAAVRSLVDRDLSALPPSFGSPADYRPQLLRFYVDQLARQMVAEIFTDPDSATPPDVQAALAAQMIETLRQQILRAANAG